MIEAVTRLRRWLPGLLIACATLLVTVAGAQTPPPPPPTQAQPQASATARRVWTVISSTGNQPLPVSVVSGREYVSSADISGLFGLVFREDRAGGLVITMGGRSVVVSLTQGLASVEGRVVSLPGPPIRQGTAWLLPVELIERALAPGANPRIDVRRRSSLIVVGTPSVPAVTARSESLSNGTRLTFVVAPAVPQTVVNENGRLLVRFAADALDADLSGVTSSQVLTGTRVVPPATIEVGLGAAYASYRATELREGSQLRLTVELLAATLPVPTEPAPVTSPETTQPAPTVETTPLLPAEGGGLRTIVIDPGHGGSEQGARGPSGTLEKNVALSIARQLKAAIEARLGIRVLLTRSGDETVALDARAAFANNNKADLFVSIHANASVRSSVAGAEVFYVTLGEYGGTARTNAAEAGALLPTLGGGERAVDLILWEMAQAQHLNESARLARILESEMRQRLPMSPRAIQQAPFRVLVGANMPAVLVETGFITNPTEEKRLNAPDYQSQIVNALLAGVVRFKAATDRVSAPAAPTQPQQDPR
jgi:N-acetylmuramoyl-L-alanine amidase